MNIISKLALWAVVVTFLLAGCEKKESPKPVVPEKPQATSTVGDVQLQTVCPVMGGAINKNEFVDYEGKRIYFCCPGCKDPFLKDPAKYVKEMEEQGITLAKAPAAEK